MLSKEIIQKMKQTNVSVNADKTQQRVKEAWKAAKAEQKEAVTSLADMSQSAVYRIYKTGGMSAKLAVAMAQILNVDPNYLTGKSDEPGEGTDSIIKDFVTVQGYGTLLDEQVAPKRRQRHTTAKEKSKQKAPIKAPISDVQPAAAPVPVKVPLVGFPESPELTEDELILLLRSLLLRVKAGVPGAEERVKDIKKLLLS